MLKEEESTKEFNIDDWRAEMEEKERKEKYDDSVEDVKGVELKILPSFWEMALRNNITKKIPNPEHKEGILSNQNMGFDSTKYFEIDTELSDRRSIIGRIDPYDSIDYRSGRPQWNEYSEYILLRLTIDEGNRLGWDFGYWNHEDMIGGNYSSINKPNIHDSYFESCKVGSKDTREYFEITLVNRD
jgi:hypothetical protein